MDRNYQQSIVKRRTPPSLDSIGEGQIVFSIDPNKGLKMYTKQGGQLWISSFYKQREGEQIDDLLVRGESKFLKDIRAGILYNKRNIVHINAASLSFQLQPSDSGSIVYFDDNNSCTVTLPDSGNSDVIGCWYTFIMNNNQAGVPKKIVCTDTTNEKILGYIPQYDADSSYSLNWTRGIESGNKSAITFDGSTKGYQGSYFTIIAVTTDRWQVIDSQAIATGTIADLFTTT